jgi:hypothetical protein
MPVVGRAKGSNDPSPYFYLPTAAVGLAAGGMHAGRVCRRRVEFIALVAH